MRADRRGANEVPSLLPPVFFLSRREAEVDRSDTEDFEFGAAIDALDDLANDGVRQFDIGGAFRTSVHGWVPFSILSVRCGYQ